MIGIIVPYVQKIRRSYQSNDLIDRLHYQYTTLVMCVAALTLAGTQYVGQPIQCWVPAQFTGAWEKWVLFNFAFIKCVFCVSIKLCSAPVLSEIFLRCRGGHLGGGVQGVQNVQNVQNIPRSAWVKTDAASKTANATSVETHTLAASVFTYALRGTFYTPVPPRCPPLTSINEKQWQSISGTQRCTASSRIPTICRCTSRFQTTFQNEKTRRLATTSGCPLFWLCKPSSSTSLPSSGERSIIKQVSAIWAKQGAWISILTHCSILLLCKKNPVA